MLCTIVTASRSLQIGDGLTYQMGGLDVRPGMLVEVPLRGKAAEGMVVTVDTAHPGGEFPIKSITRLIAPEPLLQTSHLQTAQWMSAHYCCSLRSALATFLPSSPWSSLLRRGRKKKQEAEERSDASPKAPEQYEVRKEAALTPQQELAYGAIMADTRPTLLFGITGSGKTEVYARLIAEQAKAGKQSILLVPEILLTEHIIHRFDALLGRSQIAMIHSRLTDSARREEWRRIRQGEAALVIGSRSALFSPCRTLGLVIIDEEHEWTYKNEQTPRYHAREVSETLCRFSGARLVLGSATPSLESWYRAKDGRYALARLPERYSGLQPPDVRIIDLVSVRFGDAYPFSPPLLQAIQKRLQQKEQSVLFLNRRGMATALLCLQCRKRVLSPQSQVPFTMHHTRDGRPFLLDHMSGASTAVPETCPSCGSGSLQAVGAGTQRLEDLLKRLFPEARVLRADADTLKHPDLMRRLLDDMEQGRADILCGTQSVVKGLHLPAVTLAAVLVADIGLSLPHFRAGERVFQLLSQLTGRSGRERPGEVIIQTFRPDAPEIVAAAAHGTEDYLETELQMRRAAKYPPVTDMVRLIVAGPDAALRARKLHASLRQILTAEASPIVATCAPTLTGGGKVWHILLRGGSARALLPRVSLEGIVVDVDPMECV